MIVRHEINEQEMIDIFEQFAGSIIDGYPCEELSEYLHETIIELAVDQAADITRSDFTSLLKDFISCFSFDDKKGSYLFKFEDMAFYGKTKVIRTEVGAMRKLTDVEAVKHRGGWALKSYNPVQRTKEYKKMWRYIRVSHSMNNSIYMGNNRLAMHISEFSRFIAVDRDDALRMLLQMGRNQEKPKPLVERLEWFKYAKELPF